MKKNLTLKIIRTTFILMFLFIPNKGHPEKITKTADTAIKAFAKEMKKEHGWVLSGSGGSFCNPDEYIINLCFYTNDRAKLPQGRKAIIETSDKLIEFINKNEKYKKIFKDKIFSKNNLKITLDFKHNNSKQEEYEYLQGITLRKDKVLYFYLINEKVVLKDEEIETYEQAREIVVQEKCDQENVKKHDQ